MEKKTFELELRWNPLLGEWVIVAAHRQFRPWQPKTVCPFCPSSKEAKEKWDVLVLSNKFPSLVENPPPPFSSPILPYKVEKAYGICEVIVETPKHEGDLCDLTQENVKRLIDIFTERYWKLGSKSFVKYVFIFRNKGAAIGVSLHHPHSQIYAFPFIPPRIEKELKSSSEYYDRYNRCLFCDVLKAEKEDGKRILYESKYTVAFVPYSAMWPYEIHVYPKRHLGSLLEMSEEERNDLAWILRVVTATYNSLFGFSLPYIMVFHQIPTDNKNYGFYHMHIEFYPPNRDRDKLKYAAGVEWGAGVFIYDRKPENRAEELRKACKEAIIGLQKQ